MRMSLLIIVASLEHTLHQDHGTLLPSQVVNNHAVQIGQIMLSMPNAYAKMGSTAGLVLSVFSGLISAYTIVLLVHLYEERKRRLVCLTQPVTK